MIFRIANTLRTCSCRNLFKEQYRPLLTMQTYFTTRLNNRCSNMERSSCINLPKKFSTNRNLSTLDRLKQNPYVRLMRLDKPTGAYLLFWPGAWSICLAADPGSLPNFTLLSLGIVGAMTIRSAGCVLNDMWDRKIDRQVDRTKTRPLASGELSLSDAFSCFLGLAGIGYTLLLATNFETILLANGILGLAITYPLLKRITYWPQFALGMVFNYGALLGWCAVKADVLWSACLPLYAAGICWTLVYDTIYAHQDIRDDLKIGMKSTAIRFGKDTKKWLSGFSAIMISSLVTSGIVCDQTWPYYAAVSIASAHIANQIYSLNIDNPTDCARKFVSNHHIGLVLFFGIIIGTLLKEDNGIPMHDKLEKLGVKTNFALVVASNVERKDIELKK